MGGGAKTAAGRPHERQACSGVGRLEVARGRSWPLRRPRRDQRRGASAPTAAACAGAPSMFVEELRSAEIGSTGGQRPVVVAGRVGRHLPLPPNLLPTRPPRGARRSVSSHTVVARPSSTSSPPRRRDPRCPSRSPEICGRTTRAQTVGGIVGDSLGRFEYLRLLTIPPGVRAADAVARARLQSLCAAARGREVLGVDRRR